jgi:hypothetical protein
VSDTVLTGKTRSFFDVGITFGFQISKRFSVGVKGRNYQRLGNGKDQAILSIIGFGDTIYSSANIRRKSMLSAVCFLALRF